MVKSSGLLPLGRGLHFIVERSREEVHLSTDWLSLLLEGAVGIQDAADIAVPQSFYEGLSCRHAPIVVHTEHQLF
jgi:hypothetical protein